MNHHHHQKGVAVVITILLLSFLTSMVFALSAIFIPKIKSSSEIKRSVGSIYAADSAIEYCLYIGRKGNITPPTMQNGASYTISPANCASPLKALGTYQGVTRAFEVNF